MSYDSEKVWVCKGGICGQCAMCAAVRKAKDDLLSAFRPLYSAAKRIDERGSGPHKMGALCDAILHVEANVPEAWTWGEWTQPPGRRAGYAVGDEQVAETTGSPRRER